MEKAENKQKNKEAKNKTSLTVKIGKETYINFFCCELNIGLAFTYLYVISSLGINIINRILFHNYSFNFNFIYSFLGQFITLLLFLILGGCETIKQNLGEINFSDFSKFKCYYLSFTTTSIINTLLGFYANQLVNNISMFLSLKKFTVVFILFADLCFTKKNKKKVSLITIACIFLIVGGSFLVGFDSFSNDYFGYILVFVNDLMQTIYSKLIELFRDHTGISNLKLLLYNNLLSIPILLIGAYFNGEYKNLYIYLKNNGFGIDNTLFGLIFYLILSCIFTAILLSSFFISNEKTSSLLTNLLTNTKTVFISVFLYFFDKSKNKLNLLILTGLVMSTFGSIFINAESLFNNLVFNKDDKKDEEQKKSEEVELIEVNDKPQDDN